MSVSPIDALLQIATPTRSIEPPSRGAGDGRAFGPALEQAYKSERPRESAAAPAKAEDELEAALDNAPTSYDADDQRTEEAAGPAESSPDAGGEETDAADEEPKEDEVEISEAASALAKEGKPPAAEVNINAVLPEVTAAIDKAPASDGSEGDAPVAHAVSGEGFEGGSGESESKSAANPSALLAANKAARAAASKAGPTDKAVVAGKADSDLKRAKAQAAAVEAAGGATNESAEQVRAGEVRETAAVQAGTTGDGEPEVAEPSESRAAMDGGAERIKVVPMAELSAAVEHRVAPMEGGSEGNPSESSPPQTVESTGAASSTTRAAATLDRLSASSLRRADNAGQSEGGPQIDRPRFVQRVEGALRAAQQRDGRVQVRLAPPELGSLRIELAVQNGVMTARLEAETPAARNALLDNLPALRERLAEQNIRVEKFDVDIRRDSQGSGGNTAPQDQPGDKSDSGQHERRGRPAATPTRIAAPRSSRAAISTSDAGLDVRI